MAKAKASAAQTAASAAVLDSKVPGSNTAAIMAPVYEALDRALQDAKTGKFAMFDFGINTIAKGGKDKSFPEEMIADLVLREHRRKHDINHPDVEYTPLKPTSAETYRKEWLRYYKLGAIGKVGFDNLAVVRSAVAKTKGEGSVYKNGTTMLVVALGKAEKGEVATEQECLDALAPKKKALIDVLRKLATSANGIANRNVKALAEGEDLALPMSVVARYRDLAAAAQREADALAMAGSTAE